MSTSAIMDTIKREIVSAASAPGASVSVMAPHHDVNTNLVFIWRKLYGGGSAAAPAPQLVPVVATADRPIAAPPAPALDRPRCAALASGGSAGGSKRDRKWVRFAAITSQSPHRDNTGRASTASSAATDERTRSMIGSFAKSIFFARASSTNWSSGPSNLSADRTGASFGPTDRGGHSQDAALRLSEPRSGRDVRDARHAGS